MNEILKQAVKFVLPMLINWLIKKAEKKFVEAKSGNDKKAYVVNTISDFMDANGLEFDAEKAAKKIDEKVAKLINGNK